MMIQIPDVLTPDEVAHCRAVLDAAEWIDGNATSGFQAAAAGSCAAGRRRRTAGWPAGPG